MAVAIEPQRVEVASEEISNQSSAGQHEHRFMTPMEAFRRFGVIPEGAMVVGHEGGGWDPDIDSVE